MEQEWDRVRGVGAGNSPGKQSIWPMKSLPGILTPSRHDPRLEGRGGTSIPAGTSHFSTHRPRDPILSGVPSERIFGVVIGKIRL